MCDESDPRVTMTTTTTIVVVVVKVIYGMMIIMDDDDWHWPYTGNKFFFFKIR